MILVKPSGGVRLAGATIGLDYGTSADWFVDASRPDDTGAGTSVGTAKKTVGAAITLAKAAGGGTIAIRSGTYRETPTAIGGSDTYTTPLIIQPYGTETPVITGANVLTGWTACDSGDSTLLGSAWPNCYKATVATASLDASIGAVDLNLYENGVRMGLCYDAASPVEDIAFGQNDAYHTATSFGLSGGNVETIVHNSVMSAYTDAQLLNACVSVYHANNLVRIYDVQTRPSTDRITITPAAAPPASNTYALFNILPSIQQGEWGVNRTASGGNYTVYCWPSNPANLTANIEYSARESMFSLGTASGSITIRGLQLYQTTTDGINTGAVISTQLFGAVANSLRKGPLLVKNCIIGKTWSRSVNFYSAVNIANIDDATIENNTFIDTANSFGIVISSSNDLTIIRNRFYRTGVNSIAISAGATSALNTMERIIIAYNSMEETGYFAHSNLIQIYLGAHNVLVYGNRFKNCGGYLTWQSANRLYIAFNDITLDPGFFTSLLSTGPRMIIDQNGLNWDTTEYVSYVWNNRTPPHPDDTSLKGTVYIADSESIPGKWALYNNIIHGGGVFLSSKLEEEKNNLYTGLAWYQSEVGLDASDTYDATLSNTYIGASSGAFGYTAGGKAGKAGRDIRSSAIAAAKAVFPSFDFDRDINGHPILWESAFIGPYNPRFRT